jgi:acyl-coenzyme A thioesterase PaaI-like protein
LVLPGNANITTAAGDSLIVIPGATLGTADKWIVVAYQSATVAPSVGGFSFRNRLMNAQGLVNQRGYVSGTATTSANQYTLDRWRVVTSGQNLTFSTSANQVTFTAPAGGVEQVIEGLNLESGTYVLNWEGTATATVGGTAVAKGGTVTVVGGTNTTVRFIGGTFIRPQFEAGSVATPFERRPYGTEFTLCQRYYLDTTAAFSSFYNGNGSTVSYSCNISFPTTMRAAPTVTFANISATLTNGDAADFISVNGFAYRVNMTATGSASRYSSVRCTSEF